MTSIPAPPDVRAGLELLVKLQADAEAVFRSGLELGGRMFRRSDETSIQQDVYVARALEYSGLWDLIRRSDPVQEDLDDAVRTTLLAALANGTAFRFLAGQFVEAGTQWTPSRPI